MSVAFKLEESCGWEESSADKSRGWQLFSFVRTEYDHLFCLTMKTIACLSLLLFAKGVLSHGGHEASGPAAGETIQQYAQRHVCHLFRRAELWALNFHFRCLRNTTCEAWLSLIVHFGELDVPLVIPSMSGVFTICMT